MRRALGLVVNYIFAGALALILLSFFTGGRVTQYGGWPLGILMLVLAAGLAALTWWGYRKFTRSHFLPSLRTEIILVAITMLVYLGISAFVVKFFAVKQSWDPGELYKLSTAVAAGDGLSPDDGYYYYFSAYPFQVFMGYFNGYYLKVMHHLCGLGDLKLLLLLNAFYANGAIFFTYLTVRRIFSKKNAMYLLWMVPFFLPLLLYIPVVYTDTSSLFYLAGAFFFSTLFLRERRSLKWTSLWAGLFMIFMTMASLFKVTSAIYLVAVFLYLLLVKKTFRLKRIIVLTVATLVIMLPIRVAVGAFTDLRVNQDLEYPKIHWVFMGMYGRGGFNYYPSRLIYDVQQDSGDVTATITEEIKKTAQERGVAGFAELYSDKLSDTWNDGSYYVFDKLSREPLNAESSVYVFVMNEHQSLLRYVLDVVAISRMILLFMAALMMRKKRDWAAPLKMALIGVMLFFLVWETRSRYILNFLPLFLVLWVYSANALAQCVPAVRLKKK